MIRSSHRQRAGVVAALAASAALAISASTSSASAHPDGSAKPPLPAVRPTVVLVHGAWADSGSWDGVVRRLQRDGYYVDVFPTPLRSLWGDSGALRDYLAAISGPIVLVGHSYGGAVVTDAATGDTNVKVLVYIDAFAPAEGQAVLALPGPSSALADPSVFDLVPAGPPAPTTDFYVKQSVFPAAFANDLPASRGAVLAATQRPVTFAALTQASTAPAWRTIPSWYEIGTIDKIIPPSVQRSMAESIGAHIRTARTGHLPMVSDPGAVTDTIERAADSAS